MDGTDLRVDTRKAVALVAIVTIDGPQTRESLAGLLWPESETSRARGALRRTLSVLGSALGDRWLVAEQEVRLEGGDVTADVTEVASLLERVDAHGDPPDARCPTCVDDLHRAVDLHRGELLEGFGLRDSPEFDDWRAGRAEHVRRRLARALDLLTSARLHLGDLDEALVGLERWLTIDPLNEHVHTRLMLVHAWRGERAEAVRRYRSCVAVLDAELGVAPLPRTTQVYQAIIEDRLAPPGRPRQPEPRPPAPAAARERASGIWPLVGRDELLDDLVSAVSRGGDGNLVVVTGEAGVGKSRLADAARERLHELGHGTASARCFEGESGLAFGPFVDLLRQVIDRMPVKRLMALPPAVLSELRRLVPNQLADQGQLPDPAPLDSPGARTVLFTAIWDVLEAALADGRPGILVLDELQSIDPSSVELLGYGLRRLSGRALGVVLCLRAEDAPSDLRALLDEVAAASSHRVTLPRLGTQDAMALVDAALPSADQELAERLFEESEGLPLLLVEYLRLVVDGDVDVSEDGWDLPHGARDLARSRLASLSETATQIASAAAAIGRSFDLDVVRAASGRSDSDVVDGLDELVARRLVRELDDDPAGPRYDFVHDKIRAAIYDGTSLARRRLLHARITAALAPMARRDPHRAGGAAAVAEHARLAGDESAAAEWHELAGTQARRLFANEEAYRHLEQALALGHPDVWRLRLGLGELAILLGDYAGALAALETAAAQAADDQQLAAAEHRLATVHLRRGQLGLARPHLATARDLIDDDDLATATRIEADLGLLQLRDGDLAAATEHAQAAHALADRSADGEARAQALNLLGLIARHDGDPHAARRHLAAGVSLAEGLPDPAAHIAALNNLALATAEAGDVEVALELQREAVERGARHGDRHREAALRNNLADLLHLAGRDTEALEALESAVGLFASIDAPTDRTPEIWQLVDW